MSAGPEAGVAAAAPARPCLVLDTNIVLDVFVFDDTAAAPVRAALAAGSHDWIATDAMRVELARVLAYPQIVPRLAFYRLEADDVLARFDRHARIVPVAPKVAATCKDPDDQGFIDLAVAHRAQLLSKDRAVLCMRKRVLQHGARIGTVLDTTAVDPAVLLPLRAELSPRRPSRGRA